MVTSPALLSMVTAVFSVMTSPPGMSKRLSPSHVPPGSARMPSRVARSEREMISSDASSMSWRPWRVQSAFSLSDPARPLETWAARSPNTWSGVRTLRRIMACSVALGSPAS